MFKKSLLFVGLLITTNTFASNWQVKMGGSSLGLSNLHDSDGTELKVNRSVSFTPSVEYFFSKNISTEFLIGTAFNNKVRSGSESMPFEQYPLALTLKYNFNNSSPVTPYIGLGGTALVHVPKDKSDDSNESASILYGLTGQIGAVYKPTGKNWGVFLDARYSHLKQNNTNDDDENDSNQSEKSITANGLMYTVGLSYRF